jgi:amidophosphoribosyltransferase
MSKLGDFIAFRAAMELFKERGLESELNELLEHCKELARTGQLHTENVVRQIYKRFTTEEIADKIATLILPEGLLLPPVQVIYQTIESLHEVLSN